MLLAPPLSREPHNRGRTSEQGQLLYLDLDGFKQVNDVYGHAAGDSVLKEVAHRLKASLRPYDTVARLGGDEFAILLDGASDADHAEQVSQKLLTLFQEPIMIDGQKMDIGVSIGGVMHDVTDGLNASLLVEQADSAMYEAKSMAGNHCCFYGLTSPQHQKTHKFSS